MHQKSNGWMEGDVVIKYSKMVAVTEPGRRVYSSLSIPWHFCAFENAHNKTLAKKSMAKSKRKQNRFVATG